LRPYNKGKLELKIILAAKYVVQAFANVAAYEKSLSEQKVTAAAAAPSNLIDLDYFFRHILIVKNKCLSKTHSLI
jgi:hypothetical protein